LSRRVVFLTLVLLAVPVLSQQSTTHHRLPGGEWSAGTVRPEPFRDFNSREFRLQAITQDAQDLSAFSLMLQSKKLRQEVPQ